MANLLTIKKVEKTMKSFRVQGIIVLSGSYVQAPTGEILDFSKAVLPLGEVLPVSKQPTNMDIYGNVGASYEPIGPLGGAGLTVPIQVTTAASGGSSKTELSAGAYGAAQTGDFIQFEAIFDALI